MTGIPAAMAPAFARSNSCALSLPVAGVDRKLNRGQHPAVGVRVVRQVRRVHGAARASDLVQQREALRRVARGARQVRDDDPAGLAGGDPGARFAQAGTFELAAGLVDVADDLPDREPVAGGERPRVALLIFRADQVLALPDAGTRT